LLTEVAGELPSCALIINPVLCNIHLARHDEGNNDVMTNMRLILLRANSLRRGAIRAREKTSGENAVPAEVDKLRDGLRTHRLAKALVVKFCRHLAKWPWMDVKMGK
jgi:hypothetical protein